LVVKGLSDKVRWYYATRLIGAVFLAYGLLNPKDPDRGTILLIGSGFIGGEFVAKSEPKKDK
jgi:hypothetical protein